VVTVTVLPLRTIDEIDSSRRGAPEPGGPIVPLPIGWWQRSIAMRSGFLPPDEAKVALQQPLLVAVQSASGVEHCAKSARLSRTCTKRPSNTTK
jgi:hypothetical protein